MTDAEVVSSEDDGIFQTVQIKVTRVYTGPNELLGLVVTDKAISEGSDFGIFTRPKYTPREQFLCFLARNNDRSWTISGRTRLPEAELATAREGAEEISKLSRMTDPDRRLAVRELCRHRNPGLARFAVRVVCHELADEKDRSDAASFLVGLADDPQVGIAATLEVDIQLLTSPGWSDSKTRERFFRRWTSARSAVDARELIRHLGSAQNVRLTPDQAASLIGEILSAPGDRPQDLRQFAIQRLGWVNSEGTQVSPMVFDQLVRILKSDRDEKVRFDAAVILCYLPRHITHKPGEAPQFSAEQRKVIEELLKAERDPVVAKTFRSALTPMEGQPKR